MTSFKLFIKFSDTKDATYRIGKWVIVQAPDLVSAINQAEQAPEFTKYGPALVKKAEYTED